jgi:two-component system sensor histidine kinase TctE
MGNPTLLKEMVRNLVDNAINYSGRQGVVTVRVFFDPYSGVQILQVEDNGPGIAPEVMERLFEPYVTNKRGGTGLGLAVAHRIVTEHAGTLTAETGAWGTRFTLDLPRAGPPPAAQATQSDESRGG